MRSSYKRLKPYIRPIDQRNTKLEVDLLLGVSIKKILMPSIANTIGTDMSKYKIIEKMQFAYGPVTSRNGDKISVALLEDHEAAILSQAYVVFEVIDHNELDPEYLMMWFRRPEFDRYARFKSHGSARETFDWDEMCETELPIPSIEKQREIVKEYNTVVNRIKLNEQFNQKLEETAQALYKHWFVDFEFPDENGNPYKSSGGNMVLNEGLEKEIPEGWSSKLLGELIRYKKGNAFKSPEYTNHGVPVIRVSDLTKNSIDLVQCYYVSEETAEFYEDFAILIDDIIITTVGSWPQNPDSVVGKVVKVPSLKGNGLLNQNMVRLRSIKESLQLIIFTCISRKEFSEFVVSGAQGSANQASVTLEHLFSYRIVLPEIVDDFPIIHLFNKSMSVSNEYEKEINKLRVIAELLLSKMTQVEVAEKEVVDA